MVSRSEGLLAVFLLAASAARASDAAPPTYTGTTTETAAPSAEAGRAPRVSQSPSASESAAAARTLQGLDSMLRETTAALAKTEQCFAEESAMKSELGRKRAQLSAEFNGKIPVAFNDLLWQKSERITRQHKACFIQYEAVGRQLSALDLAFANIEPKSLNVKRQRTAADQEKAKYLRMMPTAKPYNKAPKAKAAGAN